MEEESDKEDLSNVRPKFIALANKSRTSVGLAAKSTSELEQELEEHIQSKPKGWSRVETLVEILWEILKLLVSFLASEDAKTLIPATKTGTMGGMNLTRPVPRK
ncbi:uncharacterized protein Z519_07238 [Cladophialophora bantiana CBS 173.52]|uniref:Uncharacterized protein n=1 Tax=Cladophialophora bantiana (strain ATCC 10958 / CBS 173.52 / CDC B-1940 / NIH 8579) TaxID=1442370 RepID=A0A0D2I5T2_CLAB1|nr:uncharacterized protein Z519_07238 [Cladophialophora bantiana CBS 173.52]KIW92254.1 hypothetical protein Z519_07238 [Cladophialophora bantiana CBS 173.52]